MFIAVDIICSQSWLVGAERITHAHSGGLAKALSCLTLFFLLLLFLPALQKQASLIRQLEEELRMAHMRNPDAELRQHLDALYAEKEHMAKEIFLLRETIKELELRIETQKQTLASRDESIKKLMEMLQSKGVGACFLGSAHGLAATPLPPLPSSSPPGLAISDTLLNTADAWSIDRLLATLPRQTTLGPEPLGFQGQNYNNNPASFLFLRRS
ncbi:hypothetical protein HPB48_008636 [Haemaphysalis longicornis]|uniref:Uncharacterized protein n=1 Tax=Haemaphysalis longicornis TaxID=44386 RepID=A0A9J6H4W3_HAELO|nr:hypothetical protein HPB48_008636 [Haemaphysalis longicornis]